MRIEFIEPIINCVACEKELAFARIKLNSKVAIPLCSSCLYELARTFWPPKNRRPLQGGGHKEKNEQRPE